MRTLGISSLVIIMIMAALLISGRTTTHAATEERVYLPLVVRPLSLTASYLGGPAADSLSAAAFDSAGRLLLAGTFPGYSPAGLSPVTFPGGGDGAIIRLSEGGGRVEAMARIGAGVSDMEVGATGAVVACGDFGVAVLRADLGALAWSDSPGAVSRCAIGPGGGVAALVGATVYQYAAGGGAPVSWQVAGTQVADLAIDDVRGLVFAAGYTQKSSALKVAYLRAYGTGGAPAWTDYDFAAAAVGAAGLGADSEGRRVALGRDGMLYFAGFTDGGNAIYGRDPQDIARKLGGAELISSDAYNTPSNISGAKSLAWYGRFDPDSGALERGQWLLTRLSDGKGNSISIRAVDAAADGALLVTGDSSCCMQGRDTMQLNGVTLGGYEGGEPFALLLRPDFGARQLWTALAAPGTSAGGSPAAAAALGADRLAVGVTFGPRSAAPQRGLITVAPLQAAPAGLTDGYYLLMPRP
ncbi:hypothetical protein K2Z83_23255 [Oscillochloris sp. ZM17-4]|uniref:hypothetical protein n=1 Tax=Oscillochloris sp. ZM17-4 TaxID=2866714 RepID=UPI001C73371B|nr:hypothetical protein [Oscillochloris sp. ZM17-4]MBX0330579.1 hypothetical protein [Oscillochloris sp. ZM17-4]